MEKYSLSKDELTAGGLYYSNEGLHRRSDGTIPPRHTTGQGIHRTSVRFTQPARPSLVVMCRNKYVLGSSSCTINSESRVPTTVSLSGLSRTETPLAFGA